MSPYRREHSCTIDEEVTENLEPIEKETKAGYLKFVRGQRPDGSPGIRAVRIPAYIPVNEAGRMCNTLGGQFSPATPLNPKKQLLRERPCVGCFYRWVEDFEMPLKEVSLSELRLPTSDRCYMLGHKELPYKNPDGTINLTYLKGSLYKVNKIDASAEVKLTALRKLLRLSKVYGINMEKSLFKLSDLEFFLQILVEFEAKEEVKKDATAEA